MKGKNHLIAATILWAILFAAYWYVSSISLQRNALWVVLSLLLTQFGALMPDWDLMYEKFIPHRNILTHSAFLPVIMCMAIYFVNDATAMMLPLYAFFLAGYASHLLLDLRPKQWKGSACIRFWGLRLQRNRTMGRIRSFFWLLTNGITLSVLAILAMYYFTTWFGG